MKIVSKYILREFFKIFILTLFVFVTIFIIVTFTERIDNFQEVGVPFSQVIEYFLMMIPYSVFYLGPVSVLISILISIGLLAGHNEIVALKTSGVSVIRLCLPLILASGMIAVSMYLLSETVIPFTSARMNAIWDVQVKRSRDPSGTVERNIWLRNESDIYHFGSYNKVSKNFEDVSIYSFSRDFKLKDRIEAKSAAPDKGNWMLSGGLVKSYLPNGEIKVSLLDRQDFTLPDIPENISQQERPSEELTATELTSLIHRMKMEGYDPLRYEVDLQLKYSFPFICIIMAVIGLPIAFWKDKGGGIALGIGAGIGLSFIYLVFLGMSRSLGYSGLLPPIIVAWMPNLCFIIFGLFLFTHVRQ